jgi:hypothetical protein
MIKISAQLQREYVAVEMIGSWMFSRFRQQCRDSGVYQAARNLRKQGVKIEVALMMVRAL